MLLSVWFHSWFYSSLLKAIHFVNTRILLRGRIGHDLEARDLLRMQFHTGV